jgi:hypothetical protein
MSVSGACQQTAFVGNTDAYERAHLAEECHAARPNGDAISAESIAAAECGRDSSFEEFNVVQRVRSG